MRRHFGGKSELGARCEPGPAGRAVASSGSAHPTCEQSAGHVRPAALLTRPAPAARSKIVRARTTVRCGASSDRFSRSSSCCSSSLNSIRRSVFHMSIQPHHLGRLGQLLIDPFLTRRCIQRPVKRCSRADRFFNPGLKVRGMGLIVEKRFCVPKARRGQRHSNLCEHRRVGLPILQDRAASQGSGRP